MSSDIFNNIEFIHEGLRVYMLKISEESDSLIKKIIEEYSPAQTGDDVVVSVLGQPQSLRVTEVNLEAVDSCGWPGGRLSFSYKGIPLTKKGEPMKNRKQVLFSHFMKDGKKYSMPSYYRVQIVPARMHV